MEIITFKDNFGKTVLSIKEIERSTRLLHFLFRDQGRAKSQLPQTKSKGTLQYRRPFPPLSGHAGLSLALIAKW